MQTVQNTSSGSGQGSEQHSDTKRDMGGESSESLHAHNPENGIDKVEFQYIIFPSHPCQYFFKLVLLCD